MAAVASFDKVGTPMYKSVAASSPGSEQGFGGEIIYRARYDPDSKVGLQLLRNPHFRFEKTARIVKNSEGAPRCCACLEPPTRNSKRRKSGGTKRQLRDILARAAAPASTELHAFHMHTPPPNDPARQRVPGNAQYLVYISTATDDQDP